MRRVLLGQLCAAEHSGRWVVSLPLSEFIYGAAIVAGGYCNQTFEEAMRTAIP